MVFAVGLTGNIASGKTTAAKIFASLGVEVLSADKVSKELTAKNTPTYKEIIAHYGPEIILEDGELNRKRMRDIIFSNPDERRWLENLLHPLIRKNLEKQVNLCITPYCVVEIPLLLDKKKYPYLNKILVITAPQELQIARVMERDKCSKEQAQAILSAQPDDNLRLKSADDVIINAAGLNVLKHDLEKLHYKYLNAL
ncbi:dephospho-CoA kinase [Legionella maioricensis]|uniref:Dephospho-CoA kinase n=1 Tax=Legionella maioricensis TaxID=2896528 RepID=A0A9X2ID10_9GAMM|nr:dephospho-CoA kinase [Legionella maioricensis]MCL9684293.1 dephospho-CoA kinase [Legionella maioricensis]MCL9687159.1 dephospho-CoA kinase [Legionella maioricensis]